MISRFVNAAILVLGVYCIAYAAGTPGTQIWQGALGGFLLGLYSSPLLFGYRRR
jgi:membrane associated rhomboid family serine protease